MRILYTPEARNDLLMIRERVSLQWNKPKVTESVLSKITRAVRSLQDFPNMGVSLRKIVDVSTDYRWLFCEKNHIFYRIEDEVLLGQEKSCPF